VLRAGGSLIEVNPEDTELTAFATLTLRGPAGAVLARLVELAAGPDGGRGA